MIRQVRQRAACDRRAAVQAVVRRSTARRSASYWPLAGREEPNAYAQPDEVTWCPSQRLERACHPATAVTMAPLQAIVSPFANTDRCRCSCANRGHMLTAGE